MGYNGNDQDNRYDDRQWDRWNSNASHSSYYNQPTHRPYGQAFTVASLICGMLSITIVWSGLSFWLGSLGILFALLVRRKGKRMSGQAQMGLTLSTIGFALGIFLIVYIIASLPTLLRNEAYMEQLNTFFRAGTGMDFEEYLKNLWDYFQYYLPR